jgi:hypothetical protein
MKEFLVFLYQIIFICFYESILYAKNYGLHWYLIKERLKAAIKIKTVYLKVKKDPLMLSSMKYFSENIIDITFLK